MSQRSKLEIEIKKLKKRVAKLEAWHREWHKPLDPNDPTEKGINEIIDGTWERGLKGIDALNEMAEMVRSGAIEIITNDDLPAAAEESAETERPVN